MKGTVQGISVLNFSVFQKHVKIASDKDGPPLRSRISKLSQGLCDGLPHCIGASGLLSVPRSELARKIAQVILVLPEVRLLPQLANGLKRFQNGNAGLAGNRVVVESLGALLHVVRERCPLGPCERLMAFAFLTNPQEALGRFPQQLGHFKPVSGRRFQQLFGDLGSGYPLTFPQGGNLTNVLQALAQALADSKGESLSLRLIRHRNLSMQYSAKYV